MSCTPSQACFEILGFDFILDEDERWALFVKGLPL